MVFCPTENSKTVENVDTLWELKHHKTMNVFYYISEDDRRIRIKKYSRITKWQMKGKYAWGKITRQQ